MAAYRLLIKPSAVKELESIPKRDRHCVVDRIQALAATPRPAGCEKLSGQERHRARQGPYRVVYAVDDEDRTVLVVKIGHRRECIAVRADATRAVRQVPPSRLT